MQNNNPNDYLQEDEIDFKEIFKLLINSKKLIIVTTFIITLLAAIYTTQKEPIYKSTALIETGSYQMAVIDKNGRTIDYKIKLIEPTKTLIKELTIHFIHKQKANLSINSIEDTLIKINSTSLDPVKNTDLLNKVIQYIENRHSNLLINHTQKTKNQLTYEIERLNDHIEYSFSALLLRISNQIESLNNELPNLDIKIESLNELIVADKANLLLLKSNPDLFLQRAAQSPTLDQVIHSYSVQLLDFETEKIKLSHENNNLKSQLKLLESNNLESDEIFELLQEKDSLELELELLMQKNPTSTQLIGEIVTSTIDLKKDLIILLGFIFGFFLGIVMVFVNNFLKTFKEK